MSTPWSTDAEPREPLSTPRRWVLGVGVVLSLALIAYGVLWLVSVLGRTTEERRATLPATGDRLVLTSSAGDLRVVAAAVEDVQVVAKLRYGLRAPRLEQESGPEGVRLSATCGGLAVNCSVDYVVTVPERFAVEAESSAGDVGVRGVAGTVRMHSSAGDVRGEDLRSAEVRARSSAGDVWLSFAAAPGQVDAQSSAGDVEVALPAVGGYRVDADAGAGDVRLDVATDPSSSRRILARSSAGDVLVRSTATT